MPIQRVADRRMAPCAKPLARLSLDPKFSLDTDITPKADIVLETYIRATPAALWKARTDPEQTRDCHFSSRVETSLEPGTPFRFDGPDGRLLLDGGVNAVEPGKRLETGQPLVLAM